MEWHRKIFDYAPLRLCLVFGIAHLGITIIACASSLSLAVARHVAARPSTLVENLVHGFASLLIAPASSVFAEVPAIRAIGAASYLLLPLNSALWAVAAGVILALIRRCREPVRAP